MKKTHPKINHGSKGAKAKAQAQTVEITKRVLNNVLETKCQTIRYADAALYMYSAGNLANFNINNYTKLTPGSAPDMVIVQGTTQNGRIGNRIRPVVGKMRLVFYPKAFDATITPIPQPYMIRMIMFRIKNQVTSLTTLSTIFWQSGLTSIPIQGSIEDLTLKPNRDVMTVYKDVTVKCGYSTATGLGPDGTFEYYSNNDYKLNQIVEYDVSPPHIPAEIVWNDTSTEPASHSTYIIMIPISPTNSNTYQTAGRINMYYTLDYTLNYKDA